MIRDGKLLEVPRKIEGDFECYGIKLTTLGGSPDEVYGDFNCDHNNLTNLIGCPKIISGALNCQSNKLETLEGSPARVGVTFTISDNKLSSLQYMPNFIGNFFWLTHNPQLTDVSDIWESTINDIVADLNKGMAILPLVKFNSYIEPIRHILKKHQGSSKQNIISLQYDLIENGYEENARWKP